jgi:light-independent protochlorophyllide reductase subunit B
VSRTLSSWLQRTFGMPYSKATPMGVNGTRAFVAEVAALAGVSADPVLSREHPGVASLSGSQSRLAWYARSVDSTYLTGKRVFVFGDATHVVAAARIASEEMGFTVVGLGTFCREFAREVREAAKLYGVEALITDDYLEVEKAIAECAPELVLGTQMERHIAKRLGIACSVISVPIHVQDVPARYSPVFGFEGANVLFDSWVHPLVMGLEEHLLQMFRDDFEFNDGAKPSHLPAVARHGTAPVQRPSGVPEVRVATEPVQATMPADAVPELAAAASAGDAVAVAEAMVKAEPAWTAAGEVELKKIPFFVRSKARRNTERFARERGLAQITVETLYEAKAHFGR